MKTTSTTFLIAGLLACGTSFAAPKADSAQARYQQERAACTNGKSNQDRTTCLYEAKSAYDETRRGKLELIEVEGSTLETNARKRCEVLPQGDRQSCLKRMDGQGLVVGKVLDGGVYRELTEVVVPPASTN